MLPNALDKLAQENDSKHAAKLPKVWMKDNRYDYSNLHKDPISILVNIYGNTLKGKLETTFTQKQAIYIALLKRNEQKFLSMF